MYIYICIYIYVYIYIMSQVSSRGDVICAILGGVGGGGGGGGANIIMKRLHGTQHLDGVSTFGQLAGARGISSPGCC